MNYYYVDAFYAYYRGYRIDRWAFTEDELNRVMDEIDRLLRRR